MTGGLLWPRYWLGETLAGENEPVLARRAFDPLLATCILGPATRVVHLGKPRSEVS